MNVLRSLRSNMSRASRCLHQGPVHWRRLSAVASVCLFLLLYFVGKKGWCELWVDLSLPCLAMLSSEVALPGWSGWMFLPGSVIGASSMAFLPSLITTTHKYLVPSNRQRENRPPLGSCIWDWHLSPLSRWRVLSRSGSPHRTLNPGRPGMWHGSKCKTHLVCFRKCCWSWHYEIAD